jgi:hypothetical protein
MDVTGSRAKVSRGPSIDVLVLTKKREIAEIQLLFIDGMVLMKKLGKTEKNFVAILRAGDSHRLYVES